MIIFEKLRYKNFLSTGSQFTEILLNRSQSTLVVGENGSGKCLDKATEIEISFVDEETEKAFKEFLSRTI